MYLNLTKVDIMTKKDEKSLLEPNKEDMKILQQEVDDGGYFGWFGTKKHTKTKGCVFKREPNTPSKNIANKYNAI